jgi:hypothetical protein
MITSSTKQDEAFPEIALLFQKDKHAINQVIIDTILCRPIRLWGQAGCLSLCSNERNSVSRLLIVYGFFARALTEILCLYQASCNI